MSSSICLALIHNNNEFRNSYIKPELDNLAGLMGSYFSVQKIEVSYQSEIQPHGAAFAFLRDLIYRRLGRKWEYYRLLTSQSSLRNMASFARGSFIKYFTARKAMANTWRKNSAIEVIVTAKHIRSWGQFLDSGADFLICFEDDAIFKNDSSCRFINLINNISERYFDMPCYIDLGGGCQFSELKIDLLEENRDESYRYYKKPVTNTACAYLMNRQLVVAFYSILTRRPWLRLIGIDWMMNSLFIHMENDGLKCFCMHAEPTIVKHGTTTGEYLSWQAPVQN